MACSDLHEIFYRPVCDKDEQVISRDCDLLDLSQTLKGCGIHVPLRSDPLQLIKGQSIRVRLPYPGPGGQAIYLDLPGEVKEARTLEGVGTDVHASLGVSDGGDPSAFCAYYNKRFDGSWSVKLTPPSGGV